MVEKARAKRNTIALGRGLLQWSPFVDRELLKDKETALFISEYPIQFYRVVLE